MPESTQNAGAGTRALLRGLAAWLLAAAILLPVFSFASSRLAASSRTVSIIGSLISFLSAAFAGAVSVRGADSRRLLRGILMGCLLGALLAAAGFLIGGRVFHPDGLIGMLSFTLSGAVFGSVFFSGEAGKKRRNPRFHRPKKRRAR